MSIVSEMDVDEDGINQTSWLIDYKRPMSLMNYYEKHVANAAEWNYRCLSSPMFRSANSMFVAFARGECPSKGSIERFFECIPHCNYGGKYHKQVAKAWEELKCDAGEQLQGDVLSFVDTMILFGEQPIYVRGDTEAAHQGQLVCNQIVKNMKSVLKLK